MNANICGGRNGKYCRTYTRPPNGKAQCTELGDAPPDDGRWLIKRAAATHGDPVPVSVAPVLSIPPGTPVPGGFLIVIGDNLSASYDSRAFGYVSARRVFGVVVRRIGSPRR